ncbi:MAG: hypothetical protein JNJ88_02210 [Planctomycetes bacterium]|nr:hypothetical protein [Planctomycetota bacterium]
MAAAALCGAAAAQSFSSGDLCIASASLNTVGGFTPGISRVSPITGTATLVRPLNTIHSNLVFDPSRGNVIVRCKPTVASTSGLWAFDAAGNGTLLASDAVLSSNETEISVGLGGRIYLMNISTLRLRYIEPDLTIHDVLDAAGTAPYVVAGPNPGSVRAFYFDPATSTILTSSYGPAVCGPVTATSPYVTRVQLTPGGGQVAGASMTVPICLSVSGGSGGDVHDANEFNAGPNGSVYLSFDNNAYVTLGRMITINPTTLAWSTFATTSTYFGVPASNAGCYSSALNRGVLLDTFNNVLRLYSQGSGGEGTPLASGDLISSNLGAGESVSMIEIPLGTAAGLSSYGTGTPGCAGPQIMSATTSPSITASDFALVTTACPPSSLGVLVFTDAADFPGSDPFFLGLTLHVSFAAATQVGALDIVSNAFGLATSGNLPIAPTLLGQTFYAQSIWAWTGCSTPSPYALSSSNGLALTVQP